MNNKRILSNLSAKVKIILFAVIVILINLLAQEIYFRVDLTENQKYTLSEYSKNTIQGLDDIIIVKTYFSEKLPVDFQNNIQYVNDILKELQNASEGKLVIEAQQTEDDQVKREALTSGIPEINVTIREKDELKAQNVFLGMSITYHGEQQIFPVLTYEEIANLEYNLLTAIIKLTQQPEDKKRVGISTAFSTWDENDIMTIKKELSKMYELVDINLQQKIDVDTLIVFGPEQNENMTNNESGELPVSAIVESMDIKQKMIIEQAILKGTAVIFLLDRLPDVTKEKNAQVISLNPLQTGMEEILGNVGIELGTELVSDVFMDQISYSEGYMRITTSYRFFPLITKNTGGVNLNHPITQSLNQLSLKWPSYVKTTAKNGINHEILLSSSPQATINSAPYDINPGMNSTKQGSGTGKYNFAVLTTGDIENAIFANNQEIATSAGFSEEEIVSKSAEPINIITIANSHFLRSNNLNPAGDEKKFILNAVDYLTLGEELISIRAKTDFIRPLDKQSNEEGKISENLKIWIKTINLGIIPLIVILFGIAVYFKRKQ